MCAVQRKLKISNKKNNKCLKILLLEPIEPPKPEMINPELVTGGVPTLNDPNHWSKDEKYDAEACLEAPYKKHLGRHANK